MRTSSAVVVACLVVLVAGTARAAEDPFSLTRLRIERNEAFPGHATVFVSTAGTAPDKAQFKAALWEVVMQTKNAEHKATTNRVAWQEKTKIVAIEVTLAGVDVPDPKTVMWKVAFSGPNALAVSRKADEPSWGAAKDKDKANLYLFGSFVAAKASKPMYNLDAKIDYSLNEPSTNTFVWQLEANGTATTRPETSPDDPRLDADSVSVELHAARVKSINKHGVFALTLTGTPVRAEFTRKDGVADWVAAAGMVVTFKPIRNALDWEAGIAVEAGHALRRPSEIEDQVAALDDWKGIVRLVPTVGFRLYGLKDFTDEDWHKLVLEVRYVARLPLLPEPYVDVADTNGAHAVRIAVGKNPRHDVEAAFTWSFHKYAGIEVKYKYGGRPPLFQLVDHQFTVGLTVKAKKN